MDADGLDAATHFVDLDNEVQEKIFSYMRERERQIIRRVCLSWNTIISRTFGIKLAVNNLNYKVLSECDCAVELDLNSLTLPIDVVQIEFRYRLRRLTFYNVVVTYNLFPLLFKMVNLGEVSFHDVILDLPEELIEIPQGSDETEQIVSNIRKLYFQSWNLSATLLALLAVLSKLQFRSLKEIQIVTTFTPVIPFQQVFIPGDHARRLHSFVRLIVQNLPTVQLISYGALQSQTRFKFHTEPGSYQTGQAKQLEELVITHMHPDYEMILTSQSRLKVMELGCCKFETWTTIRNCIVTNAPTLEKIYLKSFTFGQEWSCDIFTNAKSLKHLALHMTSSPKTNLHLLPTSLRNLALDGSVSKVELQQLYRLSNLEQLQLLGLGLSLFNILPDDETDLQDRIGLNMLKLFIIRLPKLQTLTFKECSVHSLDWVRITNWLNAEAPHYGIQVELFQYELQGQRTVHGFTLALPENARTNIAVDICDDEVISRGYSSMLEETSLEIVSLLE